MDRNVADYGFSDAVKTMQKELGSREFYERFDMEPRGTSRITGELEAFVSERDHFYLGTASANGAPYIQHRGGPKGFLKVMSATELAFADFAGNQQYITLGNLSENANAFLFLMDYVNRRRIKIWGDARIVANDPELTRSLAHPEYRARVERAIVFKVKAWDVNCSQHILPRYTPDLLEPAFDRLERRIKELEAMVTGMGGDPGAFDHAD